MPISTHVDHKDRKFLISKFSKFHSTPLNWKIIVMKGSSRCSRNTRENSSHYITQKTKSIPSNVHQSTATFPSFYDGQVNIFLCNLIWTIKCNRGAIHSKQQHGRFSLTAAINRRKSEDPFTAHCFSSRLDNGHLHKEKQKKVIEGQTFKTFFFCLI